MITPTVIKLVLVGTIVIGVAGGLLAWRERPEPGSVPLVFLLAGQCWWSTTLIFRIDATTLSAKIFWVDVSWIGIAIIPVAWLFFALEYTGYTEYTTRNYVLVCSFIPAVTVILGLTDSYHQLLYVESVLIDENGTASLHRTPGVWFWVIAGYTYLLGLLGAIPLLQFVSSEVSTFRGQSVTLLTGLLVPWVMNILFLLNALPTAGVDPTPVAFAISGVCYLGALTRFQLFGANPTPIRHARNAVFKRMHQGAIVMDSHDHIVDMNQQAATALGTSPQEALGRPLGHVSPNLVKNETATRSGHNVFHPSNASGVYDVSETAVTDVHDRTLGRIITLHDISDFLRQQQRLEVLNRVFRHNIRTNTQVILGNAGYLATNNSEQKAAILQRNAIEIEQFSEKIRTVIDVFEKSRKERDVLRLDSVLRESIDSATEEYPSVHVQYDPPPGGIHVDELFQVVCANIVDNAAEHNTSDDPQVRVSAKVEGDTVQIRVADNGPGIGRHELGLIEEGTETPLDHGSGFGLAIIAWGTDIAGGEVSFDSNDPTGAVVTVTAPILPKVE